MGKPRLISDPEVTSGPSAEPITVQDVKKQLEIETPDTDHDTFIDSLIREARRDVENALGRSLISQEITARYEPGDLSEFSLYRPPIISFDSISTLYEGAETAEDTADFYQTSHLVPRLRMKSENVEWNADDIEEVKIVYTAGYGAVADSVPSAAKRAIAQLAAERFMYRVSREIGTIASAVIEPGSWEATVANSGLVVPRV